jgi:uncharacterized coiled-coil protein SlyX
MAKSKALIAAEQRIAALEARLSVATQVFKDQRATIRELEAKLNTRGVIATATEFVAPIVTRYTKADGSVWEKTRVGNRAFSHQVN